MPVVQVQTVAEAIAVPPGHMASSSAVSLAGQLSISAFELHEERLNEPGATPIRPLFEAKAKLKPNFTKAKLKPS